ncbi:MAG: mechanosensitive ion channel family protein [Clostridiales bacterium]|nr:mechanosensitive ion channel family protein [Clostridiales bacterium]
MLINMIYADTDPTSNITRFIGDNDGISRYVATFLLDIVDKILGVLGLEHNQSLVTFLYTAIVIGVALVVGWLFQIIILKMAELIARKWNSDTYSALTGQRFFHKMCRIIPPLVFLGLIQFTLSNHNTLDDWLTKITLIYMIIVIMIALSALIMTAWQRIDARANKRKLPLGSLAQLIKGVMWIVAFIIMIGILVDESPLKLLTGLGAFSAVLMLIFKNNILSVVAGVQLSENDSLHVGDWIEVPGTNANGTVQEVSLVSVKILNWDKTTTMLPPYNLISSGFTNYRSMQTSNTRRICRSFMIDADSVLPTTPQMLETIRKVPMMDDYITRKLKQQQEGKVADVDNPEGLVDGSLDTNLGLFRAYLKMWLDNNPNISHDSDCFISTLAQTSAGIPLQVYCFTATSKWFPYEGIQDLVFEHIAAMLRYFYLYTFENPSGRDTIVDGYLSPGKPLNTVYGVPQPFFNPGMDPYTTPQPTGQPAAQPQSTAGNTAGNAQQ